MAISRNLSVALLGLVPALPALAQDWQATALEAARVMNSQTLPASCMPESFGSLAGETAFWPLFIGEESAARDALLVQFPCQLSAYNQVFVFVLADQYGAASPVFFPAPLVEVDYAGGTIDGAVERLELAGTDNRREVLNPQYDPDSRVMQEYSKWRGLGDAHSMTLWGLRNGMFEVMRFEVDATYDGEINPVLLIDRDIW